MEWKKWNINRATQTTISLSRGQKVVAKMINVNTCKMRLQQRAIHGRSNFPNLAINIYCMRHADCN